VCIGRHTGDALRDYLALTPDAPVPASPSIRSVTPHGGPNVAHGTADARVRTSHARRADLRLTLVSPAGTRSVLQHFNNDLASPLADWTYSSRPALLRVQRRRLACGNQRRARRRHRTCPGARPHPYGGAAL
jgi:hypothetical protein